MRKFSNRMLGLVIGVAVIFWLIAEFCIFDNRQTARQYREEYREQGRRQVRAEAIQVGVAMMVDEEFVWKTEDIALLEKGIYDLIVSELKQRREDVKAKEAKEAKEVKEVKGDSKGESLSRSSEESKEGPEVPEVPEGSGRSEEEGSSGR